MTSAKNERLSHLTPGRELMNLLQIAEWLHLPTERDDVVHAFHQNSQLIEKNDLFFALKGDKVDGHHYLNDVANRGACAAVVARGYVGKEYGMQLFHVDDVLVALHTLAQLALC